MTTLQCSKESKALIKKASERTDVKMSTITDLIITISINTLNDPNELLSKLAMVKDGVE